jgi:hypothetical protein
MRRPHYVDGVSPSMDPIKYKINSNQKQYECPPIELNREDSEIRPDPTVDDVDSQHHENVDGLVAKCSSKVRD